MRTDLQQLMQDAEAAIAQAKDLAGVEHVRVQVLGRTGSLTKLLRAIKDAPADERAVLGKEGNTVRKHIEAALHARHDELETAAFAHELATQVIDVTEPGKGHDLGTMHPVQQTALRIHDVFRSMGWMRVATPTVDTDYYNFEALNMPADHPARSGWDTFYLDNGWVPRVHTSTLQVRTMEKCAPPIAAYQIGRCFRNENTDASHEHTFYQLDGFLVGDKDHPVTIGDLAGTLEAFFNALFVGKKITTRLRPGHFPFVEPGLELEMSCVLCDGKGCSACKHSGWVEMLGCGPIHPNVYKAAAKKNAAYADPNISGFAFGMGLDRMVMMLYGIEDIRWFQSGDLRFLRQFS